MMKRNSVHFWSLLLPFLFLFYASFSQRERKRGKGRVMSTKKCTEFRFIHYFKSEYCSISIIYNKRRPQQGIRIIKKERSLNQTKKMAFPVAGHQPPTVPLDSIISHSTISMMKLQYYQKKTEELILRMLKKYKSVGNKSSSQ